MAVRKWGQETVVFNQAPFASNDTVGSDPQVTALADGGFALVWSVFSGTPVLADIQVRYQRFSAAGQAASGQVDVAAASGLNATGFHTDGIIAALDDGNVAIGWTGPTGSGDALYTILTPVGAPVAGTTSGFFANGPESEVAESIARNGDGFVAAFSDSQGFGLRRFDENGNPLGFGTNNGNFAIVSDDLTPDLTALAGGGFVVAYDDNGTDRDGILAIVFDQAGNQVELEDGEDPGFVVSNSIFATDPSVAGLRNGTFVVAWADEVGFIPDTNEGSIRAQRFDSRGQELGTEFTVNTTVDGAQTRPDVVSLASGGFAVVWQSEDETDGSFDLRGQVFDNFGAKVGGEFLVNTELDASQETPEITELADGRLVVAWTDFAGANPAQQVKFQIIDPREGLVNGSSASETLFGHDSFSDEINGFGGDDKLNGLRGNDVLYGGGGRDTLAGNRDGDVLFGGSGNDVLQGGEGGDDLNGGAGTDSADYRAEGAVSINLGTGVFAKAALGDSFASVEIVFGSDGGADNLIGNAAANTFSGFAGNDTLSAGAGNDTLNGGLGNDRLTGGADDDSFSFNTALNAATNVDTIVGFTVADDTIRLENAIFTGLAAGQLAAGVFKIGAPADANDRIIYLSVSGALLFDADGNGAGAGIRFATLTPGLALTNADFIVF